MMILLISENQREEMAQRLEKEQPLAEFSPGDQVDARLKLHR